MNKKIFFGILAGLFAAASLVSCSDDEGIDPSSAAPVVAYPYDTLVADLNMVDNLPVVAVVKSQAGLRSVSLSILTDGEESVPVTTVTEFFNRTSYSLSESINYKPNYVAALVEAEDLLGRRVEARLPIEIVDVVEAPQILFTPGSWEYDETVGGEMPRTHVVVTSTVALKRIEMFRVSIDGQTQYGPAVTGGESDPWTTFEFDGLIAYGENDRSFRVRAVDTYDQVRIVSMPVKYKTVPPPTVTPGVETIVADKDERKAVSLDIESMAGVAKVELFFKRGKTVDADPVLTKEYAERPKTLAFAEEIEFSNDVSGVEAVVTDNVGRSTSVRIGAVVGMEFVEGVVMGAKKYSDGNASYPGIYSFFSLKYMKGLPLSEIVANMTATSVDADWLFYDMNGDVRIYFPNGDKADEYSYSSGNSKDLPQVLTRFEILEDFDFDNATAATIAGIDPGLVSASKKDKLQAGAVIAFKTGNKSSVGGQRIGVLKITDYTRNKDTGLSTFTISVKFPKK